MARIVVALGGNALGNNPQEQEEKIAVAAEALTRLIEEGNEIVVSHGNGPQVGMIRLAFDTASEQNEKVPPMPLEICTAMSQGYIGYQLQKGLHESLKKKHLPWQVATVVTQITVDPKDPAFENPTKPIGAFYDEETARRMMEETPGLVMREDAGRGWRQVVASPKPCEIVEDQSIRALLEKEFVVIAAGGGGIPVSRAEDGTLRGVEAVIDKDFASARLAEVVGADCLLILTAVEHVCIHYGRADERELAHMTVAEAKAHIAAGEFTPGSMLPKVEAAVAFARSGKGHRAVIGSLEHAYEAVEGKSGTGVTL
ncbi:MAG: carbamate kinase [Eubacteriales bacterium]